MTCRYVLLGKVPVTSLSKKKIFRILYYAAEIVQLTKLKESDSEI